MVKKISDRPGVPNFFRRGLDLLYVIVTPPFFEGVTIYYTPHGSYLVYEKEREMLGINEAERTSRSSVDEILKQYT